MGVKTYYSLPALIRHIRRISDDYDTFSFDLFDTLLVRRVHNPDLVKIPVARLIAGKAHFPWTAERIMRFRNKVEGFHRLRAGKNGPDHEACYPHFMGDVLRHIFKTHTEEQQKALLKTVTDFELHLEKSMLVPRTGIKDLLKELHEGGKKILILSDMYLPADHLAVLIQHSGLISFIDGIVSSADSLCAKASGAAWPIVQDRFQLDPQRWLHIGDNPISDGVRPSERGIASLILKDPRERTRKAISAFYGNISQKRPYWRGRLVQQWMLPLEEENASRDPLYIEGYNFFAPFFCAFVQHVAERCRALKIRRIYFLSREGKTFFDLWQRITPWLAPAEELPEAHFLAVSRAALAHSVCAHVGLTIDHYRIAFLPPTNRDARDLARVYGLDISALQPWFDRYHIRIDEPLSRFHKGWHPGTSRRFELMLEDPGFQSEVKRQALPSNQAFQRYLESERFFEQPEVALIDIGWLGTIQRYIYESIVHRADKPILRGMLFATIGTFPFPTAPGNQIEGFIYDRSRIDFSGSLVRYARELFEEASRANQAGILAYRLKDQGFELVFRDTNDPAWKIEQLQSQHFASLQQGIFDAADRYGPASAIAGFKAMELKPWLNVLMTNKIAFPSTREILNLRQRHHVNDFGGTHVPLKKFQKTLQGLWQKSPAALRFNPFLRVIAYLEHAVHMLRQ